MNLEDEIEEILRDEVDVIQCYAIERTCEKIMSKIKEAEKECVREVKEKILEKYPIGHENDITDNIGKILDEVIQ